MIFLDKVAIGDGGRDLGDVAHLVGQVAGHEVDAVGQIFPRAGHAGHLSLPAQLSFGTHFARHTRHFGSKCVELIHHRVDAFL